MKVSEILDFEKDNTQKIHLIKEGIFWRAYEVSAMLFANFLKNYKLIKKFVKCVESEIIYMGFPDSSIDFVLKIVAEKGFTVEKQSEEMIILSGFPVITDFDLWKDDIMLTEKKMEPQTKTDNITGVIEKIKNYPIAMQTPVEAMSFVAEIQKELKGVELKFVK